MVLLLTIHIFIVHGSAAHCLKSIDFMCSLKTEFQHLEDCFSPYIDLFNLQMTSFSTSLTYPGGCSI